MENAPHTLEHLIELELTAEEILADRREIIDLDRQRQKMRQAVRELHRDKMSEKTWLCFGNMFIQFPKQRAKQILDTDFSRLDAEITDVRNRLKPKVNKLQDLENKPELRGFHLNPLSQAELNAVKELL
jgi:chaperonin cofactor prefoldin